MNRRNIQRTIDLLRDTDTVGFDMATFVTTDPVAGFGANSIGEVEPYRHACGTTACIAGHIVLAFPDEVSKDPLTKIFDAAQAFLGLQYHQAEDLFYGYFTEKDMEEITREEAITELEWLLTL